jgi:hypothetical protein
MPRQNDDVFLLGGASHNEQSFGRTSIDDNADRLCVSRLIGQSSMEGFFQSNRQTRLQKIRFVPLPFGREQSDALCEALQGMTTFVMKPDV